VRGEAGRGALATVTGFVSGPETTTALAAGGGVAFLVLAPATAGATVETSEGATGASGCLLIAGFITKTPMSILTTNAIKPPIFFLSTNFLAP
jgi:hypothetical protein